MDSESGESGFDLDSMNVGVESLPNIDSPPVDSIVQQWIGSLNHSKLYSLRLTPPSVRLEQEIFDFLSTYSEIVLMVREESRRDVLHYHIIMYIEKKNDFIKELKTKYRWAEGNRGHSCTKVRDPKQASVYCLKETDHVLKKNISDDMIERLRALSFVRFDRADFAHELASLRMQLLDKQLHPTLQFEEAAAYFLALKNKYGQIPNWTYAENWAHMILASRYTMTTMEQQFSGRSGAWYYYYDEMTRRQSRFARSL